VTSPALTWLRWVAQVLLLASVIPVGVVIAQLIKARRAPFYIARELALRRVKRWVLVALLLLVLGLDLWIIPPRLAPVFDRPSEQEPYTPAPTSVTIVTFTPRPTQTPTVTPTRRPTATPPFIPTPTSDVPLPESALSPLPSAVPAGEGARIGVITLAADRDDRGQPVDPATEFPPGDRRVYLFVHYEGMANGVAWTFAIYREGALLDSTTQLWEWGAEGMTYLYYKPPGGYEPGTYEMRVFVEHRLKAVAQFAVRE
jgi:hypothetical protein